MLVAFLILRSSRILVHTNASHPWNSFFHYSVGKENERKREAFSMDGKEEKEKMERYKS